MSRLPVCSGQDAIRALNPTNPVPSGAADLPGVFP